MVSPLPIIIIGTGLAGYSLAKELKKLDPSVPLVLITQDDGHFYSKPQLSTALALSKPPEALIITPFAIMQKQLQATIYTHSTVTHIEKVEHTITLTTPHGQKTLAYAKLVFAHGAQPKPFAPLSPDCPTYRINNLADYCYFRAQLPKLETLTILGSGLVGCEFAHDLLHSSLKKVSIVTPSPYPLHGMVPKLIGTTLQKHLSTPTIEWHTQCHTPPPSQAVLAAIGIVPNTQLASQAGIQIHQGIAVNAYLQTSEPDIYAIGDCAEIEGHYRPFIAPILPCARALAQTLCHTPTPLRLPPMPIALKVATYPVVTLPPPLSMEGSWHYTQEEHGIKALFFDTQHHLQGFSLSGHFTSARLECLNALGTASLPPHTSAISEKTFET